MKQYILTFNESISLILLFLYKTIYEILIKPIYDNIGVLKLFHYYDTKNL